MAWATMHTSNVDVGAASVESNAIITYKYDNHINSNIFLSLFTVVEKLKKGKQFSNY